MFTSFVMEKCIVTHINSPSDFCCQIGSERKFADFDRLEALIQGFCGKRVRNFHSCSNVEINEVLFVKSTTLGIYTRARVSATGDKTCTVQLVDYGMLETTDMVLKVDPCVQKFAEIPDFAHYFGLAYTEPMEESWSVDSIKYFGELVRSPLIHIPTEGFANQVTLLSKTHHVYQDISECLVRAGYAKHPTRRLHSLATQTEVSLSVEEKCLFSEIDVSKDQPRNDNLDNDTSNPNAQVRSQGINENWNILPGKVEKKPNFRSGVYVAPGRRAIENRHSTKGSIVEVFKLNHPDKCTCILCTIQLVFKEPISCHEKIHQVISARWDAPTLKQINFLKFQIIGGDLHSEIRSMLLDITLAIVSSANSESATTTNEIKGSGEALATLCKVDNNGSGEALATLCKVDNNGSGEALATLCKVDNNEPPSIGHTENQSRTVQDTIKAYGELNTSNPDVNINQESNVYGFSDPDDYTSTDESSDEGLPQSSIGINADTPGSHKKPNFGRSSLPYQASASTEELPKQRHSMPNFLPAPTKEPSSFGAIMFCSFCGDSKHPSVSCPTGTKNLFL